MLPNSLVLLNLKQKKQQHIQIHLFKHQKTDYIIHTEIYDTLK